MSFSENLTGVKKNYILRRYKNLLFQISIQKNMRKLYFEHYLSNNALYIKLFFLSSILKNDILGKLQFDLSLFDFSNIFTDAPDSTDTVESAGFELKNRVFKLGYYLYATHACLVICFNIYHLFPD